jgi:hypothetical protein
MVFYFVMMLITSLLDDFGDVGNIQVLVQGLVGDIQWCICYHPQYFGLTSLHYSNVRLAGATPKFYSICPDRINDQSILNCRDLQNCKY